MMLGGHIYNVFVALFLPCNGADFYSQKQFNFIIQREKETFYEQRKNDFKPFIPTETRSCLEFTPTAPYSSV